MDVRTDGHLRFTLLGRLGGVDLKMRSLLCITYLGIHTIHITRIGFVVRCGDLQGFMVFTLALVNITVSSPN